MGYNISTHLRAEEEKVKQGQIPPEDLKKLIALLHSIGNPKEIQSFIQYFYGKKLSLTFISSCKNQPYSE